MAKTPHKPSENSKSPRPHDDLAPGHPKPSTSPDDVNPPRTTTGPLTAPKFGSAGSGGAEIEPGIKRN